MTLQCNFDTDVDSCSWTHNEPMNEDNQDNNGFDISCTGVDQLSGQTCDDDTRITFQQSGSMCGITIQNSEVMNREIKSACISYVELIIFFIL